MNLDIKDYVLLFPLTINVTNILEWKVWLHNRDVWVYNYGGLFESDLFVRKDTSSYKVLYYDIYSSETTYIYEYSSRCNSTKEHVNWNSCMEEHTKMKLGCTMPWQEPRQNIPNCTSQIQELKAFIYV
jgi:hypothetical protein